MKFILFCQNNYAYGILNPIKIVLNEKKYDYLWYVSPKIKDSFPFKIENHTFEIKDLEAYKSDVIFVPGNAVPYYLKGLKTQIFHGLAGEKKGHFRIRHYFDLYLTQGPYFTEKFIAFRNRYKNFDVIETGWPKLDIYGQQKAVFENKKHELLAKHNVSKIILYAPTFSPKLTSAPFVKEHLKSFAKNNTDCLVLLKFHPLMDKKWIDEYKNLAQNTSNIIFQHEKNITEFLLISDILVSDTSSVIYEFLLLDKPVITFNNISQKISWQDTNDYSALGKLIKINLFQDPFRAKRIDIFNRFHPYNDGKSAERMVKATEDYIKNHGVPERRKLSILRRLKIHSLFGKPNT